MTTTQADFHSFVRINLPPFGFKRRNLHVICIRASVLASRMRLHRCVQKQKMSSTPEAWPGAPSCPRCLRSCIRKRRPPTKGKNLGKTWKLFIRTRETLQTWTVYRYLTFLQPFSPFRPVPLFVDSRWDLSGTWVVGLIGGTYRWDLDCGTYGGTYKWDL